MKPHVICLMACRVDGRTLSSRWRPKGAAGDHFELHQELAGDAWLVGRVTGQEFAKGKKPYPVSTKKTFPRDPAARVEHDAVRPCVAVREPRRPRSLFLATPDGRPISLFRRKSLSRAGHGYG